MAGGMRKPGGARPCALRWARRATTSTTLWQDQIPCVDEKGGGSRLYQRTRTTRTLSCADSNRNSYRWYSTKVVPSSATRTCESCHTVFTSTPPPTTFYVFSTLWWGAGGDRRDAHPEERSDASWRVPPAPRIRHTHWRLHQLVPRRRLRGIRKLRRLRQDVRRVQRYPVRAASAAAF